MGRQTHVKLAGKHTYYTPKREGARAPPAAAAPALGTRSRRGASVAPERTHPSGRSAVRAAKHAQGRVQAEDRLRQLAGKMAKVQRWRASQEVWT
jgi:hypothetical protein